MPDDPTLWPNGPLNLNLIAPRTFPISISFGPVGVPGTTKLVLHADGRIEGSAVEMAGFLAQHRGEVQLPAVVFWLLLRALRDEGRG
jgi:hypothetical protein